VGRGGEWTESYRRRYPVAVGISARSKRINIPAAVNSSPSATVILPSADVSPKVQMIIVNEGGHFMYREHPEQFNHDAIGFVDFWAHQTTGARPKTISSK
jgi:pimeloyl-ACP methyl ester carboxylesterase